MLNKNRIETFSDGVIAIIIAGMTKTRNILTGRTFTF